MIFVTGGAGFIGSNFILEWLAHSAEAVINIDKLTYAGNLANLKGVQHNPLYHFVKADINDAQAISKLFNIHKPRAIIHFAAESHVDRSIAEPEAFIKTNVHGTFTLLQICKDYWNHLEGAAKDRFRFLHVSTDEVYGSLNPADPAFTETTPYAPNSPYAASKAGSDHLVRAYFHTYGLPILITNCSNNYGPYQFPEKLIPLMILNAIQGKPLPVYGDGLNIRDWLYVTDHCAAIRQVLLKGQVGEQYNIGGCNEKTNLEVVNTICSILDEQQPNTKPYASLIHFIKDRPGHDRRYAIDATKIKRDLDWQPQESFQTGIKKTVEWYLQQTDWVNNIQSGEYQKWLDIHYHQEV